MVKLKGLILLNDSLVLIKIKNIKQNNIIKFLVNNNIFYDELTAKDNYLLFKTKYKNVKIIRKEFKSKNFSIKKFYGKRGILHFFKINYILLLSLIWGYILLMLLSHMIFNIEIITEDKKMKHILSKELSSYEIKKYRFKKSYKELDKIKKAILEDNKTILEWIEIEEFGTKYIINFTPRIIPDNSNIEVTPRDIIAKKDALIMHIVASKGEIVKEINDYVRKGEVVISRDIKRYDILTSQVRADGKVYGEVWYTVNTTIPYKYIEYVPTGEIINHYYLNIFGKKMTLLGKYDTKYAIIEKSVVLDKPYLFFKIMKERKELYEYKTFNLSKEEAMDEALKRSIKSVEVKLNEDEYVISKKVLKIEEYSSKITIEVFFKVCENITEASN
jgi:similar to stage IV sporulation protein